jgi:hypothetical protein
MASIAEKSMNMNHLLTVHLPLRSPVLLLNPALLSDSSSSLFTSLIDLVLLHGLSPPFPSEDEMDDWSPSRW